MNQSLRALVTSFMALTRCLRKDFSGKTDGKTLMSTPFNYVVHAIAGATLVANHLTMTNVATPILAISRYSGQSGRKATP